MRFGQGSCGCLGSFTVWRPDVDAPVWGGTTREGSVISTTVPVNTAATPQAAWHGGFDPAVAQEQAEASMTGAASNARNIRVQVIVNGFIRSE